DTATIGEAEARAEVTGQSVFPVVDGGGGCVATVSVEELAAAVGQPEAALLDVATREVAGVRPDEPATAALNRLVDDPLTHLVVLDADDRLLGMVTAFDLLRARSSARAQDVPEPGWATWRRRLSGSPE